MPAEPNPEVIELCYEDGCDPVYVRGHHLGNDRAVLEVAGGFIKECESVWDDDWRPPTLAIGRRLYARWGFPHEGKHFEHGRGFHLHTKPSRGAFAITEVVNKDILDADLARREKEKVYEAELLQFFKGWLPEAVDVFAHTYPLGEGHVDARLPGLDGRVRWRAIDPGHVNVERRDLAAWERLYADRKPDTNAFTRERSTCP